MTILMKANEQYFQAVLCVLKKLPFLRDGSLDFVLVLNLGTLASACHVLNSERSISHLF